MIEASLSARAIQNTALSIRLAQLASALPIEKIAKDNVKAITKPLHIERAWPGRTLQSLLPENIV
jgi:hypothetical protein